jgi:Beta-lactamase class A
MNKRVTVMIFVVLGYIAANAQIENLKADIQHLIGQRKATIGVSVIANHCKDTLNINEREHYPMQSVFKFPITLALLAEVDNGKFKLNQQIDISANELLPDTWSPIREKYPNGTSMKLADIIRYTIEQSDNNGCDILLRLLGGTASVEKFLAKHQLRDIAVKATEADMHKEWSIQYRNWATPVALTNLLIRFYATGNEKLLSTESRDFLWRVMSETSTGANRLKGQLPQGTIVAHKTGTSATNDRNVTAAINDIGIMMVPNKDPIFITVLVSNSTEDGRTNEKLIADIAKKVWNYYSK